MINSRDTKICPKCEGRLFETEDGNYFCKHCGILEEDELELLEALLE